MLRSLLQIETRSPSGEELSKGLSARAEAGPDTTSNENVLDFIVSDESLDRFGEVLTASGWRLEAYRRNPVFQNAHQYGDILFTLGKALITEVRALSPLTLSSQPSTVLYQRIQFATGVNPMARIAYGLYRGRFLNAVSVGFVPLRWQDAGPAENSADGRSQRAPGTTACRRRYLEQELLEVSAVAIPANRNALALGLKSGAVAQSDLRDTLDLLRCLGVGAARAPEQQRRLNRSGSISRSPLDPQFATRKLQLLAFARELRRVLRRS